MSKNASARPSKRSLALVLDQIADEDQPDMRSADFNVLATKTQPVAEAMILDVFSGMTLLDDKIKVGILARAATTISDSWDRAQHEFICIGRTLLELQRTLSRDENARLLRDCRKLFPFGKSVASILRSVAEALESERLTEEECPRDYSTAGMLARMGMFDLELARGRGIVHRDVKRAEVEEFRRSIRARGTRLTIDSAFAENEDHPARPSLADLRAERGSVEGAMRELVKQFRILADRRRALRTLLTTHVPQPGDDD